MGSWRELIAEEMESSNDSGPLIACTLDGAGLDRSFGCGYGCSEGAPFTAWTATRVYFPVVYDGAEWVGSAPRNPCDEESYHHGGQ